jgi:hypothetical protein
MRIWKEKMIKCERCGREVEKIWQRKYCLQCRRIKDYELKMEYKKKQAALKLNKQKNEISSNENN